MDGTGILVTDRASPHREFTNGAAMQFSRRRINLDAEPITAQRVALDDVLSQIADRLQILGSKFLGADGQLVDPAELESAEARLVDRLLRG